MDFFDESLSEFVIRFVDDKIDAAEVICGLHDIIHVDALVRDADGVRFEDVPGLLMGEAASFDMVGIVGKVNLSAMIYSSSDVALFLFPEPLQERILLDLALPWKRGIGRDVPSLSHEKGSFDFLGCAPVADGTLGKAMLLGEFSDGFKFHAYRQISG